MAKKAQSTIINMLLSLTIIAVVAAAALALVNNVTADPIEQAKKAKKEAAVKAVLPMPNIDKFEPCEVEGVACTKAFDAEGNLLGMAVESGDDNGFGGHLGVMVGFTAEGLVSGYQILETAETPGLGAKADLWFQEGGKGNIIGKNPGEELKVKKDGGDVDAISGSTITSRAFCRAINNAYQTFQKGGIQ